MKTHDQPAALVTLLLALADDEFVIGYANSEWTGIAPMLEEDIAFSSLAQDELGHARLLYQLASELDGRTPDALAYGRTPDEYCSCLLVERPGSHWAYSVSRQFLYDTASYVVFEQLQQSSYLPLARAAAAILREEKYHLLHGRTWLEHLSHGGTTARQHQRAAFEALWPDLLGMFAPLPGEAELCAAAILPVPFASLQQRWLSQLAPTMHDLAVPFPFVEQAGIWHADVPAVGGHLSQHSTAFIDLYTTITSVYRLDPAASW